jgi:hypothetical protein
MMKSMMSAGLLATTMLLLPGCVSTVGKVVTAPVRATSKAVDWTTTSGEEADRNRGRRLREKCKERYDAYYCGN